MNDVHNKFVDYDNHFDHLDSELLKQLPIGSIIAWSGSLLSHSQIPVGWQLCDGSLILEGNMLNLYTPELNAANRFLRGTDETCKEWTYQDHMMPAHRHNIYDPGHKHEDAGHRHPVYHYGDYDHRHFDLDTGDAEIVDADDSTNPMSWGYADIQDSYTSIRVEEAYGDYVNLGNEVRPKNMLVEYIIKIF